MSAEDDFRRYTQAAHAMQSAVAFDMQRAGHRDTEPKHLRVGVNSAMVDASALAKLLIDKGVIAHEEYVKAVADGMEAEVKSYADRLGMKPENFA